MARDPVCGMNIEEQEAKYHAQYKGETYYFCSPHCKASFEKDPETLLNRPEPRTERRKVAIIGAGQVGATCAYALMISGLPTDIVLVDAVKERAQGQAMDLNHGLSFVQPARISAGDYPDCRDADIVVVTAGAAQKPGETRLDLVRKNTEIFKDIIPRIVEYDPKILLIVANPVDVLTYVALKVSQYPMSRVIGSGTVLDTARFRYLLGNHCDVDPRNVHAYVIGEHGDSELAVWSQTNIAGLSLHEYCPICGRNCAETDRRAIFDQVKGAAYDIIQKKGATNFGIGLALVRIIACILRDENSVLTVSTLIDDYYGIDDVCLSVPVKLNRNGISRVLRISLDDREAEELRTSAGVLKDVVAGLDIY